MTAYSAVYDLFSRRGERMKLRKIFQEFADYTMLSEEAYIDTLQIAAMATTVKGCVVQCGVWRGGLIAGLAKVLGTSRDYFLFDSFEGLPPAKEIDGESALAWQRNTEAHTFHNNCTASSDYADRAMRIVGSSRYHIIEGWFESTIPSFVLNEPISVLHLDADWYDSTTICLRHFFGKVRPGGVIILDDYYTWDGCCRALHDYLSGNQAVERIRNHGGICYLKKR